MGGGADPVDPDPLEGSLRGVDDAFVELDQANGKAFGLESGNQRG
jgi:hypothetical protein